MATEQRQLVRRIAAGVAAVYTLLVLLCLTVNASVKAYLGVPFGRGEALECVYGPAITLASAALLWAIVSVIVGVVHRANAAEPGGPPDTGRDSG